MAKKTSNEKTDLSLMMDAETDPQIQVQPKSRRKLLALLGVLMLLVAGTFFVLKPGHKPDDAGAEATPTAGLEAGTTATPQDVLNKEMNPEAAPADIPPPVTAENAPSEPVPAEAAKAPPIPPPPAAEAAAQPAPSAEPEVAAVAAAEPEPPAPPPPPPAPKAKAKTSAKKYTMAFSRTGTKVPAALKKEKVMAFLAKKLNGDKSCIPSSLLKKQIKPFSAIVSLTKAGSVTSVDLKPKLPQAKAIGACIKKKLAGGATVFKSKSASKVTVAIKVK